MPPLSMLAALRRLSLRKGLALALALAPLVASPARADDAEHAKELFQQGTTLFNIGEFDKAIEAWQEGYKAKPDPGFLFNIAQAYRLKGDGQKAIFFYRGYLRNSPKAANRADVEARIAALQKAVSEKPPIAAPVTAPSAVAPAPVAPPAAPAPAPALAPAPPAVVAPPFVEPPPVPAPMNETPPPSAEAPAAAAANRPVDLGAALGFAAWTSGVRGSTQPSFAFDLAAGYAFGNDVFGAASFRLGAFYGYTFLKEPASTVGFSSLLVAPSVRVRLAARPSTSRAGSASGPSPSTMSSRPRRCSRSRRAARRSTSTARRARSSSVPPWACSCTSRRASSSRRRPRCR